MDSEANCFETRRAAIKVRLKITSGHLEDAAPAGLNPCANAAVAA
jgi:hypothetical protein